MKVSTIGIIILILIAGYSLATDGSFDAMPAVPSFASLDERAASDLADSIVANHLRLAKQLNDQLDDPHTLANRKVLIVYALGQLRSPWATNSLIKMVDFPAPFLDPALSARRWGPYPCVDALAAIGAPSVSRIIDVLPEETNPLRVHLLVTVIFEVEGLVPGRAFLENALANAKGDSARLKLQNAMKEYDGLTSRHAN